MIGRVEVYGPAHREREFELADGDTLRRTFDELRGQRSATIELEAESGEKLIIGASHDRYTVSAFVDDDFCELVGDPAAEGETDVVLGGQPAPYPTRLLVSEADAADVGARFVEAGRVDRASRRWEQLP